MTDVTLTEDELTAKLAAAAAEAVKGLPTQADNEAATAKAIAAALEDAKAQTDAAIKLAVDKEKSKREDIEKRLKAAKKQQVPSALEGLSDDAVDAVIKAAEMVKGMSDEKLLSFVHSMANNDNQTLLVEHKNRWIADELTPLQDEVSSLKAELSSVKTEATRGRRNAPLAKAVLAHCNSDVNAQEDALRRISAMFEDGLDDEGKLIPKQTGDHLGIDPATNTPFTPDTAAKHLASTIFYLAKPSSTTPLGGNGAKPTTTTSTLSVSELLAKAKTQEERDEIIRSRMGGAS